MRAAFRGDRDVFTLFGQIPCSQSIGLPANSFLFGTAVALVPPVPSTSSNEGSSNMAKKAVKKLAKSKKIEKKQTLTVQY